MPTRSIIEVDVNDTKFKTFVESFDKYKKALADMPEQWGKAASEADSLQSSFQDVAAALLAQTDVLAEQLKTTKEIDQTSKASASSWERLAKNAKNAAGSIGEATRALLKWSTITGAVSGLLGLGGLFGIERLALGASGTRRASLGLGTTYGEASAFNLTYGRYVDPSFLGNVENTLTDPAQRYTLSGLGLRQNDIQGKSTAQVAQALIPAIKKFVDKVPLEQLQPQMRAYGLDNLVSVQEAVRIKNMSQEEIDSSGAAFNRNSKSLDIADQTARKWQDLDTQLDLSAQKIKATFIDALGPLTPEIAKLSETVADLIQKWGQNLKPLLETFDKYLSSGKFESDFEKFVKVVETITNRLWDVMKRYGIIEPSTGEKFETAPLPTGRGVTRINNPGNIRSGFWFQQYATPEAGVRAMDYQVKRDIDVHGLDTLNKLIGDKVWGWAPASDHNDVEAYVKDISKQTGIGPNDKLDSSNIAQRAAIDSAITRHEQGANNPQWKGYTPKVIVEILNNSGGSVAVQTSQLPQ